MPAGEYIHVSAETIKRVLDGAFIPKDVANRDYQAVLAWVAAGNTLDPFVPHVDTPAEVAIKQLQTNDALMFRGLEVLIDVLLAKGTVLATDFPPAVRTLYLARKAQRTAANVP